MAQVPSRFYDPDTNLVSRLIRVSLLQNEVLGYQ
jgi:hypothetical protein